MSIVLIWKRSVGRRGLTLDIGPDVSSVPGWRSPLGHRCLCTGGTHREESQDITHASNIPAASIITSLVINPHYHCHISASVLSSVVRDKLPNLQSFRLALLKNPAWARDTFLTGEDFDLLSALPSTVDDLSVVRGSGGEHEGRWEQTWLFLPLPGIGDRLATQARSLCVTDAETADTCLTMLRHDTWAQDFPRLNHFGLRLLYARDRALDWGFNIRNAACLIFSETPNKLKSFIIWQGTVCNGYLIRFFYGEQQRPAVTWRSTWHTENQIHDILKPGSNVMLFDELPEIQITRIYEMRPAFVQGSDQGSAEFPELRRFRLGADSEKEKMFGRTSRYFVK